MANDYEKRLLSRKRNNPVDNEKKSIVVKGRIDLTLVLVIIALVCFGVIMIFSASYYDNGFSTFKRTLGFSAAGLAIMAVVANIDYKNLRKFIWVFYWVCIALLILTLVLGQEVKGASRRIFGMQPSEFMKPAMILCLADHITKRGRHFRTMRDYYRWLLQGLAIMGGPFLLIVGENLSTAIIVVIIGLTMLYLVSPYKYPFVIIILAGILGCAAILKWGPQYRMERVLVFLNPEKYSDEGGYQVLQGLYAIGSGGFFGLGIGQSRQKLGYIPESHNDIIFAVLCEELGLFGAILIVLLYSVLIWRGIVAAINAVDLYSSMVAAGIVVMVAAQVIINIGVVTNSMPNTGITLPFISYGGSSLLSMLGSMGMLLNIARYYKRLS